jgi:dihydroorotate dehydrogenase (fumarate)
MTVDLRTHYLGLELRTPLIASSNPMTGQLSSLLELEDAGIAAVTLPSLFEEEIVRESLELHHVLEHGAESFGEAMSYLPELDDYGTGPDRYLQLIAEAKERLSIPIVASLNATSTGGWTSYARLIEEAGADALELNIYAVAADPGRSGIEVETEYLELVRAIRESVRLPLAVKLSPYFSSFAHFATAVEEVGADGLVLFNRFYQPDLDLETLTVRPELTLSQPWELRLPLRWIAILRPLLACSLAATTGIADASAVAKALLVGADATMMASAILRDGAGVVRRVEQELVDWLEVNDYTSVVQLKGSVSHEGAEDPAAFERANYVKILHSWSGASSG